MKRIKKNRDKTSEPNCNALDFPFVLNIEEKIGIKAAENAPSANKRLKKLGSLKATKKTSAITPAPTKAAIKISLTKPKILLINVKPLIVRKLDQLDISNLPNIIFDRNSFENHQV